MGNSNISSEDFPLSAIYEAPAGNGTTLHDSIKQNLIRSEQQALRNVQNGNNTEVALCGQLILVTTVILTGSGVVLVNMNVLNVLSISQRTFLLLGVVLLIMSLFCGIKYYFVLTKYFFDWAFAEHEVVSFHENLDPKTVSYTQFKARVEEIKGHLSSQSPNGWLKGQVALLGFGSAVYILFCGSMLFSFEYLLSVFQRLW